MKKFFQYAAVAALALGSLASCDDRPNPVGEWTGTLSTKVPGMQETMDATFGFSQDGNVQATYDVNCVEDLPGNDNIVAPFQATISAAVSQQGRWQYVDGENDEIIVTFDPQSLQVNISPDRIVYNVNGLTGQETTQTDSISAVLMAKYTEIFRNAFLQYNATMHMDDVKVDEHSLHFELDDVHYDFSGSK